MLNSSKLSHGDALALGPTHQIEHALSSIFSELHGNKWEDRLFLSNAIRLYLHKLLSLNTAGVSANSSIPACDTLFESLLYLEKLLKIEFSPVVYPSPTHKMQAGLVARVLQLYRRFRSAIWLILRGYSRRHRAHDKLRETENIDVIIHYHADFSGHPNTVQSLYRLSRKACAWKPRSKLTRRGIFYALIKQGISEDKALLISETLPTSLVENYCTLHRFGSKISPSVIVTSIYGIMDDPLLAIIAARCKTRLLYVQHGGAYCLVDCLAHRIEAEGCERMLYWGLGPDNVSPSHLLPYAENSNYTKDTRSVLIIFSTTATFEFITAMVTQLKAILLGFTVTACLHPRSSPEVRKLMQEMKLLHVIGITNMQVSQATLVVFDSILHTLLYLRIVSATPFFVLQDLSTSPQFPRACRFLHELSSNGLYSSFSKMQEELRQFVTNPDYSLQFQKRIQAARSLVVDNPTLWELAEKNRLP